MNLPHVVSQVEWGLLARSSSLSGVAQPAIRTASDVAKIHEVLATFHRAASAKDLGLMMSLFTDDATLSMGGQTYTGKGQVRAFFATVAESFQPQNHWLSLTASPNIRIEDRGDRVRLYFESVYVDAVTMQVKAHLYADATLVRIDRRWLIRNMEAGPASLASFLKTRVNSENKDRERGVELEAVAEVPGA